MVMLLHILFTLVVAVVADVDFCRWEKVQVLEAVYFFELCSIHGHFYSTVVAVGVNHNTALSSAAVMS